MNDNLSHAFSWRSCTLNGLLNNTFCPLHDTGLVTTTIDNTPSDEDQLDTGQSYAVLRPVLDDVITRIVFYTLIFVFSTVGNVLVIVTLAQNRRMRNVTNVFLFNLAISDLLLGVFCMPFTLVGSLLRDFVFGETMCRIVPYIQAVSVSVSVWTLVSLSLERFFAICRPLHSRKWQTVSHAKRIIFVIWLGSFLHTIPIGALSALIPLRIKGKYKCREMWPNIESEQIFNIYLDVVLLILPLLIMTTVYMVVIHKVRKGGKARSKEKSESTPDVSTESPPLSRHKQTFVYKTSSGNILHRRQAMPRQMVIEQKLEHLRNRKRRIVVMLMLIVAEFFICWTPLYVINTWSLFDPQIIYEHIGSNGIAAVQLLAYVSSCCNPITYCFMNQQFRQAFVSTLHCSETGSSLLSPSPRRNALRETVI